MENTDQQHSGHVVAVPYPAQGHINPILQFCKRLSTTYPVKTTLALTAFISNTFSPQPGPAVALDTISDGFDEAGFSAAASIPAYLAALEADGSRTLSELIRRHAGSKNPITCVLYDSFLPWALTVAKKHGLDAVAFFTQTCTVDYLHYNVHRGVLRLEDLVAPVAVAGLEVELSVEDIPRLLRAPESRPAYLELALNQFSNVHLADCILINTMYELEPQVVDSMSKHFTIPLLPIGPTIPSFYLNKEDANDKEYGLHLFNSDSTTNANITDWLSTKPPHSVIFVSFGSMVSLDTSQVQEVVCALRESKHNFLWSIRATEKPKLPEGFVEEMSALGKGMFVEWCSQLQALASSAIGCFLTHCGWNSTQEALVLGVPMVAMPQYFDQPTNAKLMEDVWGIGVVAKGREGGIVKREVICDCIGQVMKGDKAKEMRVNVEWWKGLAKRALAHGGSSATNVDAFVSNFVYRKS